MDLHKILKIITIAIALIGIVFTIMLIGGNEGQIGNVLVVAYIVLAIVLLLVVVFTLKGTFSNADTLKSTLTSVGAFALVALICYFGLASGTETVLRDGDILSVSGSKLVGAGLYMFYCLVFIAFGTMLFSGIKKMIK